MVEELDRYPLEDRVKQLEVKFDILVKQNIKMIKKMVEILEGLK